jgi:hypothetical protein
MLRDRILRFYPVEAGSRTTASTWDSAPLFSPCPSHALSQFSPPESARSSGHCEEEPAFEIQIPADWKSAIRQTGKSALLWLQPGRAGFISVHPWLTPSRQESC